MSRRVLHVITRYLGGGTERDLAAHIRWQLEQGDEVHVAVGRESDPARLPAGVTLHHVRTLVRSPNPVADGRAWAELRRLIRRYGFQVVHTHQSKAGIVGRLAAPTEQSVIVHTVSMASFGPGYSRPASELFRGAERLCARSTDLIVTVGDELRSMYLDAGIGSASQYLVVRSPIDLERFLALRDWGEEERRRRRAEAGLAPEGRVLVAVGALEPRKRQRLLVERLAPLLRRGDTTLLLAGEGVERPRIEAAAAAAGVSESVRLLGHVADVPGLLGMADVFVHAGTAEGVPQVVVQALAAGLPVVATEVTGLREWPEPVVSIVGRDGEDLASAVEAALAAPRPPLPAEMLRPWHPDCTAEQTEDLERRIDAIARAKGITW